MRIKSGIDIVKIDRIKSHIESSDARFFERCFTKDEYEYSMSHKSILRQAESLAARFAAKEAAAKALGSGICTGNIGFCDFEVVRNSNGSPEIVFHGEALNLAQELQVISQSVSLSHEDGMACAVVTLLTNEGN